MPQASGLATSWDRSTPTVLGKLSLSCPGSAALRYGGAGRGLWRSTSSSAPLRPLHSLAPTAGCLSTLRDVCSPQLWHPRRHCHACPASPQRPRPAATWPQTLMPCWLCSIQPTDSRASRLPQCGVTGEATCEHASDGSRTAPCLKQRSVTTRRSGRRRRQLRRWSAISHLPTQFSTCLFRICRSFAQKIDEPHHVLSPVLPIHSGISTVVPCASFPRKYWLRRCRDVAG